jgi:hypothetical protein
VSENKQGYLSALGNNSTCNVDSKRLCLYLEFLAIDSK